MALPRAPGNIEFYSAATSLRALPQSTTDRSILAAWSQDLGTAAPFTARAAQASPEFRALADAVYAMKASADVRIQLLDASHTAYANQLNAASAAGLDRYNSAVADFLTAEVVFTAECKALITNANGE